MTVMVGVVSLANVVVPAVIDVCATDAAVAARCELAVLVVVWVRTVAATEAVCVLRSGADDVAGPSVACWVLLPVGGASSVVVEADAVDTNGRVVATQDLQRTGQYWV